MPKHYAKRHLTRHDPIFDNMGQIDTPNDDTTTNNGTTPSRQDQRGEADPTGSTSSPT